MKKYCILIHTIFEIEKQDEIGYDRKIARKNLNIESAAFFKRKEMRKMSWEFTLLDALQCIHTPVLDKLMVGVTFLGDAGWFWIALGVLLLFTKNTERQES